MRAISLNNYSPSAHHRQAMDGVYRLRHEVFNRHLGWQVQSKAGREVDEFDNSDAVYGAYVNRDEVVEGCYRLLPTTSDYMLSKTFRQYFDHDFPSDPNIYECSRFAVHPQLADRAGVKGLVRVTSLLLHEQITWALHNDIHTILCLTDVRFERVLRMAGLETERTSDPIQIGKTMAVSGFMFPSLRNLDRVCNVVHRLTGIELPRSA